MEKKKNSYDFLKKYDGTEFFLRLMNYWAETLCI